MYAGHKPLEAPLYRGSVEVAHYLRIPERTIRDWIYGRNYPQSGGVKRVAPIIHIANTSRHLLSFTNLIELHVLDAIRRDHQIQLNRVRTALAYLRHHFGIQHPLADEVMTTDGKDLFVKKYGQLINVSAAGQLAMRSLIEAHLRRIERDPTGIPLRLYPFTRKRQLGGRVEDPTVIVIDPTVAFGRPVIAGTRIPTAEIAERYKAGDSIHDLMRDYGREEGEIEEAIRCELPLEAA